MFVFNKLIVTVLIILLAYLSDRYIMNVDLSSLIEYSAKPIILGEECDIILNADSFSLSSSYLRLVLSKISDRPILKYFLNGEKVFLKRLGSLQDYQDAENTFKNILQNKPFDSLDKTEIIKELIKSASNETNVKIFLCPSPIDIYQFLGQIPNFDINDINNLINVWTAIRVSPEPLMLKILQPPDWPVPKYYGSCGRVIVVEDCGRMLSEFSTAPWAVRADLAIKLLKMGMQFTLGHNRFGFYWTDLSAYNIAVSESGEVKLIDVENVFVVDKSPSNVDNLPDFNSEHSYEHSWCENCFSIHPHDICNYKISDYNILSICRELLANTSLTFPRGLLHDPPKLEHEFKFILEECIWNPGKEPDRFLVAENIISLLQKSKS